MTEFIFALKGKSARLISEQTDADRAIFRLEDGKCGMLVIGKARIPLSEKGTAVSPMALESGIHIPVFFVDEKTYTAPRLLVAQSSLSFLPPTDAALFSLEKRLEAAQKNVASLEKRLSALEKSIEKNKIF